MLHPRHHDHGILMQLAGTAMLWLENHGLGLVGLASIVFGMVIQWKTYRLRVREFEAREGAIATTLRAYPPRPEPRP